MRRFRPLLTAFLVLLAWSASVAAGTSLTSTAVLKADRGESQFDPAVVPDGAGQTTSDGAAGILDDEDDGCASGEPLEGLTPKPRWSDRDMALQPAEPRLADRRLTTLVGSVVLLI